MSNGIRTSPGGATSMVACSAPTGLTWRFSLPASTTSAESSEIWWGSESRARTTTAPRTEAGNRSNTTSTETGCSCSFTGYSGPLLPRAQVLLLLRGQLVDLDPHGPQLQQRDLGVDLRRHRVDGSIEAL